MKKSKLLSLVLITSALASCRSPLPSYETQYNSYIPPDTSMPEHWNKAFLSDSTSFTPGNQYDRNGSFLYFQVPSSFYTGPNHKHSTTIERGGFGVHGLTHSFSS